MAGIKKYSWGKGPLITRVRLNPEQAVLTCGCHDGTKAPGAGDVQYVTCCASNKNRNHTTVCTPGASGASS